MTKLEKPQALENLDAILELSDAVMVARGDLGVELPPEEVPLAQKRIVRAARARGIPVVVATQMLESMINAPAPTRAEASDVATAVFDGADAVMLSAETAAGQLSVRGGEHHGPHRRAGGAGCRLARHHRGEPAGARALRGRCDRRRRAADRAHDRGARDRRLHHFRRTALRIARERPDSPVLGLTPDPMTARRLAVAWGVHAVVMPDAHSMTEAVSKAIRIAMQEGFAGQGEEIVVAAGVPFGRSGHDECDPRRDGAVEQQQPDRLRKLPARQERGAPTVPRSA